MMPIIFADYAISPLRFASQRYAGFRRLL